VFSWLRGIKDSQAPNIQGNPQSDNPKPQAFRFNRELHRAKALIKHSLDLLFEMPRERDLPVKV
jgi:hypothetical protein